MKVKMILTIDIDGSINDIGRANLKDHIVNQILSVGDKRLDDPLRLIDNVHVSKAQIVLSQHDAKVAGGKARASSLSAKRRKEIATMAANARWAKSNQ